MTDDAIVGSCVLVAGVRLIAVAAVESSVGFGDRTGWDGERLTCCLLSIFPLSLTTATDLDECPLTAKVVSACGLGHQGGRTLARQDRLICPIAMWFKLTVTVTENVVLTVTNIN